MTEPSGDLSPLARRLAVGDRSLHLHGRDFRCWLKRDAIDVWITLRACPTRRRSSIEVDNAYRPPLDLDEDTNSDTNSVCSPTQYQASSKKSRAKGEEDIWSAMSLEVYIEANGNYLYRSKYANLLTLSLCL